MAKIETTVTIARPREEVFSYFLTLEQNVPKTNPDVEWVVKSPDGPTRWEQRSGPEGRRSGEPWRR
jgi:uncharacterized membrane protein